jgi:curved DNA-binding protein
VSYDPYRILGVERDATTDEIRHAYRALARRYHPDLNQDPDAEERFKELGEALSVLTDKKRRQLFDHYGEASLQAHFDPQQAAPEPSPPDRRQHPGEAWTEATTTPRSAGPPLSDLDVVVPLEIDLLTAITGGEARGSSPHSSSAVKVSIPPGVETGYCVRVQGRGRPGRGGHPPGDLLFEIHVQPHPFFRREGADLVLDLPITIEEAHLGARIQIPTLEGWLGVRIPPNSRGGERLRLRGRGLPVGPAQRGDLHVHLCVRLPERLDAAGRLLQRLSALYVEPVRSGLYL